MQREDATKSTGKIPGIIGRTTFEYITHTHTHTIQCVENMIATLNIRVTFDKGLRKCGRIL